MIAVLPLGRFFRTSDQGFLINECTTHFEHPWVELVAQVTEECTRSLGTHLHSLYIRGSVARGTALKGFSDLDTLAVLSGTPGKGHLKELCGSLNSTFPNTYDFCTQIDLNFLDLDVLLKSSRGADYRFMLKTQSVCIHGTNLCPLLPEYSIDENIAFGCRFLERDLANFQRRLLEAHSEKDRKTWCGWIMRKLLRAGGEIAMLETRCYTRDLFPCCTSFGDLYPLEASQMRAALQLAVEPSDDVSLVVPLVNTLGAALMVQIGRRLREF